MVLSLPMERVMAIEETSDNNHKIIHYKKTFMPLITVSMYPGRTQQQKDDFAKVVTKSAAEILKTKEDQVIVVFKEIPKENWFLAGNQL